MSKKEEMKEQLETEALMDAEIEAATVCAPEDKKEKKETKDKKEGCCCGCGGK